MRVVSRIKLASAILAATATATSAALGEPKLGAYSDYERETVTAALLQVAGQVDDEPEGKVIEAVDVQVLDVIEERDPAPAILNVLHCSTRRRIVERELLFGAGEPYERELVLETERNLRALRQHSLVTIVPLRGTRGDRVRVLVIAKDVWSLRLNSDYRIKGGALEYLLLQPAEENLFGTHQRVAAQFVFKPDTISFGARYTEPRLGGSRLLLAAEANAIVNQATGDAEGTFGFFQYGVPLYSTRQRWAWGAVVTWRKEVSRRLVGTTLDAFEVDVDGKKVLVPFVYGSEAIAGRASVTRSFGTRFKHDVQLGVEVDRRYFDTHDIKGIEPRAVAEFTREEVPRAVTRNGPYAQYHFYATRFARLHDVETLGLEETFIAGPELYARIDPVAEAFGSTRDLLGAQGSFAATAVFSDALVRGLVAGTVEARPDGGEVFDSAVQAGLRAVSPRVVVGRLTYDATVGLRPDNLENAQVTLGGEGRLRGYPSGAFRGANFIASNLEFRSRAFSLGTVQLGGALFYDVGDAFDAGSPIVPKQGAGFGLRLLFPQLGRALMRFDWGFPLTRGFAGATAFDGLVITFQQAYLMPSLAAAGIVR